MMNKRVLLILFCIALVVRLLSLTAFYQTLGSEKLESGDAITFLNMARNLESTGTLSSLSPPSNIPTANYPPLYPFFLFLTRAQHSIFGSLAIQNILGAVTVVLIYILGMHGGFSRRASMVASLVFAIEPGVLFYTSQFYTETLFILLFLGSLILLLSQKSIFVIGSALLLGLATLTRPVGMYIAVLFLLFLAYMGIRNLGKQRTIILLLLFTITFMATVVPWFIRNGIELDSYIFSTQPSYLTVGATLPAYLSWHEQIPFPEAQQRIVDEFVKIGYTDQFLLNGEARLVQSISDRLHSIILGDPLGFIMGQFQFAPQFFLSSGWQVIYDELWRRDYTSVAFGTLPPVTAMRTTGSIFWSGVSLLALLGVYAAIHDKKEMAPLIILWVVIIFMFAFLTGALAHTRYRMPVTPIILLFAGHGVFIMYFYLRLLLANLKKRGNTI